MGAFEKQSTVAMIELTTDADLHREGCRLAHHCWRSRRWSDVDLAATAEANPLSI